MRRTLAAILLAGWLVAGCSASGGEGSTIPTTAPTTTTTMAATSTTATSTTTAPATTTTTTTTTMPATTTTTTLPEGFPEEGRVNVLLMGGDSGVGRHGIRTDTMIVLSIDPATGEVAMFGIPRNLWGLPFPPGHPGVGSFDCGDCFGGIANEIYQWGAGRPDLFGEEDPGAAAAKTLLGHLLGLEIHYYALVDLQGFVDVIDAVGGIDIQVFQPISDDEYPNVDGTFSEIDLAPGTYHMEGHQALYYARSRHATDDFNRMARQRCVLQALAQQVNPLTWLGRLAVIREAVATDLPPAVAIYLIELLPDFDTATIAAIRFMPNAPEFAGTENSYIAGWTADRYPMPDRDFIAATVATVLSLPPADAISQLGLQPLETVCGPAAP